jgi:hypothetical protein
MVASLWCGGMGCKGCLAVWWLRCKAKLWYGVLPDLPLPRLLTAHPCL